MCSTTDNKAIYISTVYNVCDQYWFGYNVTPQNIHKTYRILKFQLKHKTKNFVILLINKLIKSLLGKNLTKSPHICQ